MTFTEQSAPVRWGFPTIPAESADRSLRFGHPPIDGRSPGADQAARKSRSDLTDHASDPDLDPTQR
jgi:hypothetical protein